MCTMCESQMATDIQEQFQESKVLRLFHTMRLVANNPIQIQ